MELKSLNDETRWSYRLGERGSLHAPLLIATLLLTTAGFGIWGVMRSWQNTMKLQLRLDRCVGEAALEFRNRLYIIESANTRIRALRIALAAATIKPILKPPLKVALTIEAARQDYQIARWKLKQADWLLKRGCGKPGDLALPLPAFQWTRLPADPIGQQPLSWPGEYPNVFRFQAAHFPRISAAQVHPSQKGGSFNGKPSAHWATPVGS
ncbi:MAG: hypothetical protein A2428_13835 [Bdellovibrionales bacterium RIFOXYC1_FULL_54_43]|nr:MAG: hypothetical protein A2428_13835 [Bdellovibrionales bacterium RIFOXYC1_FULL_54_43]OFZ83560.1 MAG: hypothetical protein A2603_02065 [Bdellovibrionales bacterium RIFOXYD1_FULL_55_31]